MLSKSQTKALVLRFDSIQDCLDFSDKFIELNSTSEENEEDQCDVDDGPDNEAVMAHIIRMMHESSFTSLVNNLETTLSSTEDGTRLLESWKTSDDQSEN